MRQRVDDARIAVVGLGYTGLPLAVEFGKQFEVVGFDIDARRIEELRSGHDRTSEMLRDPVMLVSRIEADLRARGWRGAAPKFGGLWRSTFLPRHATARRAEAA